MAEVTFHNSIEYNNHYLKIINVGHRTIP